MKPKKAKSYIYSVNTNQEADNSLYLRLLHTLTTRRIKQLEVEISGLEAALKAIKVEQAKIKEAKWVWSMK